MRVSCVVPHKPDADELTASFSKDQEVRSKCEQCTTKQKQSGSSLKAAEKQHDANENQTNAGWKEQEEQTVRKKGPKPVRPHTGPVNNLYCSPFL